MRKTPKPLKKSDVTSGRKTGLPIQGKQRKRTSDRRNFLKTAGLVTAAAMSPRTLKAMMNTNKGWLEAVELSRFGDFMTEYSLDIAGFRHQECDCWCWAATAYNLRYYYGITNGYATCDIVSAVLNDTNCTNRPDHSCCQFEDYQLICDDMSSANTCNNYGSVEAAYECDCGDTDFGHVTDYILNHGPVVAYVGYCAGSGGGGGGSSSGQLDGCNWIDYMCGTGPCPDSIAGAHYLTLFGYWLDGSDYDYGYWVFDPDSSDGVCQAVLQSGGPVGSFPQVLSSFSSYNWWGTILS